MDDRTQTDMNQFLMMDGNAVAGILDEVFSAGMTPNLVECANCARQSEIGELLTFTHTPGLVLRCPQCESIVLRIGIAPDAFYLSGCARSHVPAAGSPVGHVS